MKKVFVIIFALASLAQAQEHQSGNIGLGMKRFLKLSSGKIDFSGWAAGSVPAFRADGTLVDTTLAGLGGAGLSVANARRYTGWTAAGTAGGISQDTLATKFYLGAKTIQFKVFDTDGDSVNTLPEDLLMLEGKDGSTSLWSFDSTGVGKLNSLLPNTNGAGSIGSGTLSWSNLFVDSAAVLNFDNGDITITHQVNLLKQAGGAFAINEQVNSAALSIDGNADIAQFSIQGHSTQTNPYMLFENSVGTDLMNFSAVGGGGARSEFNLIPSASGAQTGINLRRFGGGNTGFLLVSDAQGDNTDIFSIFRWADSYHVFSIDAGGDVTIGSDASAPNTLGWADLGITGDAGTATFGMTNETLGEDATSGLLISVPTSGAMSFNYFENAAMNFLTNNALRFQIEGDGDASIGSAKAPASGTITTHIISKPALFTGEGTPAFSDSSLEIVMSSGQPTLSFKAGDGDATNISVNNSDQITFNAASGGYVFSGGGVSYSDTTGFVLAAAGTATVTSATNIIIDSNAAAALDTVTTLTGIAGQIIYISSRVDTRDITFLDAGNFTLGGERLLDDADDVLVLKATSATTWKEVSFVSNN